MAGDHKEHIIYGPKFLEEIPNESYGTTLHRQLRNNYSLPVALVDAVTRQSISFKTVFEKSSRLAYSLQKFGINQNDVIAISSGNNVYYPVPLIAGLWTGATATTYNPEYTIGELTHVANISRPNLIFCSKTCLPLILLMQKKLKFIKKIIIIDGLSAEENVESMEDFIERHCSDYKSFKPVAVDSQKVALILYSSGTTGLPKGVMLTHYNLNVCFTHFKDPRFFTLPAPGTTSTLCLLPFFHGYGQTLLLRTLFIGETAIVLSKFEGKSYLEAVQNFKIRVLWIVPSLAHFLANNSLVDNYQLSHVEEICCGGAPLSKQIQERLVNRFQKISYIRQAYGLTEATVFVAITLVGTVKPDSIGKLVSQTMFKVVDINSGRSLGPGEDGELCIKGPQVMKGYAGDSASTHNAIDSNGWLKTGDIGHYDEDGFIYIVDRLKDLIKYKAFQVAPAELEALLLRHPKILDAAVIGLPDERAGEVPMAFIVKGTDESLSENEIKNYVAEQVSSHKRLRGGVQFIHAIPKSLSGKIEKKQLRQLLIHKAKL